MLPRVHHKGGKLLRNIYRLSLALTVSAALATLSACGGDDKSATSGGTGSSTAPAASSAAPAEQPADVFAAAIKDFASKPYKYSLKMGPVGQISGSADPAANSVAHTASLSASGQSIKFEITVAAGQHYLKVQGINVPGANGNWIHFDPAKVPNLDQMGLSSVKDPTGLTVLQKAVVTAKRSGDKLTGTFDATKVGNSIPGIDADDVPTMGDKAKAVQFEGTLDANGQLASLSVHIPAYGSNEAETATTNYSGLGTPVTIAKPSKSVEATDAMYKLFNS